MAGATDFRYRAFLSYAHADVKLARRLHAALEGFRIDKDLAGRATPLGPVPASLRPIFRDREDFSGGHSLTDATIAALDASAALIVICSPVAATRPAVNEEVRLFRWRHPGRPVIPVIIAGTPHLPLPVTLPVTDGERVGVRGGSGHDVAQVAAPHPNPLPARKSAGRGDECFPPALRFAIAADGGVTGQPVTILGPDLREEADGWSLGLAKIVAGLTGVAPDDIYRRAERQRRKAARFRNAVIAVLALLAVAASGSALYAWQQLKTNEAFLDATLDQFTRLVNRSVDAAQAYSLPISVTLGFLEEAEGMLQVMAKYGRETPKLKYRQAIMLRAFADNYRDLGRTADWERRIKQAQSIMAELARNTPASAEYAFEQGLAHERAGDLALAKGDLQGAMREYDARRQIIERLAKDDPKNAGWQRDLSVSYNKVGDVLVAQGNLPAALDSFKASLAIAERLAKDDPKNAGWQRDLSVSQEKVGDVLVAQGNLPAALDSFKASLAIRERLAKDDPKNAGWQYDLGISNERIGDVQMAQGDLPAALKSYENKRSIISRLAKDDPKNAGWQRDLAVSHSKLSSLHQKAGDRARALGAVREGRAIMARMVALSPDHAGWKRDLAWFEGQVEALEK